MARYEFWLGACVEFQPVGLPGWAWGGLCEVWWEGDNARGSRPHEGGFVMVRVLQMVPPMPKRTMQ
jgi:hypothetical protein